MKASPDAAVLHLPPGCHLQCPVNLMSLSEQLSLSHSLSLCVKCGLLANSGGPGSSRLYESWCLVSSRR